jgi:hypothetical protein
MAKKFDPATQYLLLRMTEFKLKRNLDRGQLQRRNEIVVVPALIPAYFTTAARSSPPPLPITEFLRPSLENRGDLIFSEKKGGAGYKWGGGGLSIFRGFEALSPDYLHYDIHVFELDDPNERRFWAAVETIAGDPEIRTEIERFGNAAEQVVREFVTAESGLDLETEPSGVLAAAGAIAARSAELIASALRQGGIQYLGTASGDLYRDENYALNPNRPIRKRRLRHKDPGGFVLKLKTEFKNY